MGGVVTIVEISHKRRLWLYFFKKKNFLKLACLLSSVVIKMKYYMYVHV